MILKQGDIVKLDFDPTKGHEQTGYRPALVVSRTFFNAKTGQAVVCPITNRCRPFPMRLPLDERTLTRGFIMCDQVRTIDTEARGPKFIEALPGDLLEKVLLMVSAIFEKE